MTIRNVGFSQIGTKGTYNSVTSSKTISKQKSVQRGIRGARRCKDDKGGGRGRTDEIVKPEQRPCELAVVLHDDPDF